MAIDPKTGIEISPTIDATKIGSTTSPTIPSPFTISPSTYTSAITNSAATTQAQLDAQTAQREADAKLAQSSQTSNDIANLQSQVGQKSYDTAQIYENSGLNKAYNELQDINAQMIGLKNEASAIPIQLQQESIGRGRTEAGIAPLQTAQLRDNALKALSLGQQAAIAEGNYNKAKNIADQKIQIKYDQLEANIKSKQTQLAALDKYTLTPAQEKAKEARALALKREEQDIADRKSIDTMIEDAIPNAPSSIINNARKIAEQGGSKLAVAQALGIYGGDYLSTQIKKAQLAKLGLENKKAYDELYANAESGNLKTLSYEENAKFNSTPEAKGIKDATSYAKAVADYKSAIEKYGTGELVGEGSGALGQAYSALVGATKDYYTLGTLDNGVQKLISLGIPEPSILGLKKGRIDALDTALDAASNAIKRNSDQLLSTRYKNTNELKQLMDNANGVLMYRMSNQDFLSQIPGSSPSGTSNTTDNTNFFNK